jgi:hypothetical protein
MYSQNSTIKWGEKEEYGNDVNGFFAYVIGTNDKYVYTMYYKAKSPNKYLYDKKKIVAFDKSTLKLSSSVAIKGFEENKGNELLKDLDYYKTVIFNNVIYVFWMKESKEKDELYVESFSSDLKRIANLKKIYELISSKGEKKKAELLVLGTKNEQVLIGGEKGSKINDNIKFVYKLLDSKLDFIASNEIELPIKVISGSNSLSSSYSLGKDGNLYLFSYVTMTKEDKKELMKYENSRFCIFSVIQLEKGTIKSMNLKFEGKNIYNLCYEIDDKNNIEIYGFYSDLEVEKKGNLFTGIFYTSIQSNDFELTKNIKFIDFKPEHIIEISSESNPNKKETKIKKPNSISSEWTIKSVNIYDNNRILICTRQNMYYVTQCSSNGACYTKYYQNNNDILSISLSNDGNINWIKKNYRSILYSSWYNDDVYIANKDNLIYIFYGNQMMYNNEKGKWVGKPRKLLNNSLDYLVLNPQTGDTKTSTIMNNKPDVILSATNLSYSDNELYINSTLYKLKTGPKVVGAILLVPTLYLAPTIIKSISSSYIKTGYFGKIECK